MRKLLYFGIFVILLLSTACESPLKIKAQELDSVSGSLFNEDELCDLDGFSQGYQSGNIQTDLVNLSWTRSADEDFLFYKLFRNNQSIALVNDRESTSFTDSLVTENSEYLYQITVISESGMVANDTLTIKTPQWSEPSNLAVNGLSATDVKLTWDDNSDSEDIFQIFFYDYNTAVLIDSFNVAANVNEKIVTDLDPETTYSFQVRARNQWEEDTPFSGNLIVQLDNFVLFPPSNLSAIINSDMTIELNWVDNATLETGVVVQRSINDSGFYVIADLTEVNVTSFVDADTTVYQLGDMLTYRVRAYNDYEGITFSGYSNECPLMVEELQGINEGFESGQIPLNWVTGGDADWSVDTESYTGMYSARSGQIGHYDQTFMQTTIQVPMYTEVSISFARQTASEGGCDRLRFFINSYEIDNWSGNVNNWATETYTYNSQENTILTLQWAYTKDGSVNSGQDACWVDDIQVTW